MGTPSAFGSDGVRVNGDTICLRLRWCPLIWACYSTRHERAGRVERGGAGGEPPRLPRVPGKARRPARSGGGPAARGLRAQPFQRAARSERRVVGGVVLPGAAQRGHRPLPARRNDRARAGGGGARDGGARGAGSRHAQRRLPLHRDPLRRPQARVRAGAAAGGGGRPLDSGVRGGGRHHRQQRRRPHLPRARGAAQARDQLVRDLRRARLRGLHLQKAGDVGGGAPRWARPSATVLLRGRAGAPAAARADLAALALPAARAALRSSTATGSLLAPALVLLLVAHRVLLVLRAILRAVRPGNAAPARALHLALAPSPAMIRKGGWTTTASSIPAPIAEPRTASPAAACGTTRAAGAASRASSPNNPWPRRTRPGSARWRTAPSRCWWTSGRPGAAPAGPWLRRWSRRRRNAGGR